MKQKSEIVYGERVFDRSKGFGKLLFDWLVAAAKKQGCEVLALDSGVQRFGAQRFYLIQRMNIVSHHFALRLKA